MYKYKYIFMYGHMCVDMLKYSYLLNLYLQIYMHTHMY